MTAGGRVLNLTGLLLALVVLFLPDGVLNVVTGFGETAGAALVAHSDVDKIAFTGSTAVGRIIMREAAGSLKKLSLELGGKSPNIVLADADIGAAARGAFSAIFYNTGQCCTAGSRLLVHESVKDQLLSALVERAGKMQPGDPLSPKTRFGPLISQEQLDRVLGYIEKGRSEGGEVVVGGARAAYGGEERGFWLQPTVFDGVQPGHIIAKEEIFGPVLSVLSFSDEDEALSLANQSEYGLAAGVWTQNVKKAHRFARERRAVARRNIELCFPDLSATERNALALAHFEALGMSIIELALGRWASDQKLLAMTRIEGAEHIRHYTDRGVGVILLSAHFTTLEISGRVLSLNSPPFDAVYRKNRSEFMTEILRTNRERSARSTIEKNDIKSMVRSLKDGVPVWYAPDQVSRGATSALLPFFGTAVVIYLLLWIYGLAIDHQSDANFIPVNTADDWLHFALGVGMVGLGVILTGDRNRRIER